MPSFRAHAIMTYLHLQQQVALMHPNNTHFLRRSFSMLTSLSQMPNNIEEEHWTVAGVPTLVLRNKIRQRQQRKILLYLHGGGYVIGSPDTHKAFAGKLGLLAQADEIWLPDYRLAPEHPFPAGLNDALEVWRYLQENYSHSKLLLAGESAGGGLSAAICIAARDEGLKLPERVYLQSPWLDLSLSGESYNRKNIRDPFLSKRFLERDFAQRYAADTSRNNPLLSPLFADLHDLPPIYLQIGSREVLLDESRKFCEKASSSGVDIKLEIGQGLWHGWPLFAPYAPESTMALRQAGLWLGEK